MTMTTMMTGSHNRGLRRGAAVVLAAVLTVTLASCAPESGDIAGASSKDGDANPESSWSSETPDEVTAKKTELPASFPKDSFIVPAGATIDDAGERESGSWFVVFRAGDADTADTLWAAIISGSGLEVSDLTNGEAGEVFATLTKAALTVEALRIPQPDGTELLSYEVTRSQL